jgi:hypothetical protein
MFPFAFIPFPLITHICFSLLKNDLRQLVRLTIAVRGAQFIVPFVRSPVLWRRGVRGLTANATPCRNS